MTLAVEPEAALYFNAAGAVYPPLVETILLEVVAGELGNELEEPVQRERRWEAAHFGVRRQDEVLQHLPHGIWT